MNGASERPLHLAAWAAVWALAAVVLNGLLGQVGHATGEHWLSLVLGIPFILVGFGTFMAAALTLAHAVVLAIGPRAERPLLEPTAAGPFRTPGRTPLPALRPRVRWYHRVGYVVVGCGIGGPLFLASGELFRSRWLDQLPVGLGIAVIVAYFVPVYAAMFVGAAGLVGDEAAP